MLIWKKGMWLGAVLAALFGAGNSQAAVALNVYSTQQEHLVRPILDQFEKENPGIKVNITSLIDGSLIERLAREGKDTPADIVMTADVANLYKLQQRGLLAPVQSKVLAANIPAHLRDTDGHWFGFTTRSRVIYYARDRVKPHTIKTYADLADPKWKGKIMVRSSSNDYNQSLLANILAHEGREAALKWAKGVVANMADVPTGGDRDQMRAIASGKGDIALANTYYYGLLMHAEEMPGDAKLAEQIGIIFPNQGKGERGAQVNIRGGGVAAHSKHPKEAQKLLEFLSSEPAQTFFSETNYEYPANPRFKPSAVVMQWGRPRFDTLPLAKMGELNAEAVRVFDEAGWK